MFPETDQELTFVFNITIDMYMSWLICFDYFFELFFQGVTIVQHTCLMTFFFFFKKTRTECKSLFLAEMVEVI